MHLFALWLIFLHPYNALFFFVLWRCVIIVMWNEWVPNVCANCLCLFHLYFFVFSLEAVSPAFVLPLAAILIVEAFVFVFCFALRNSSLCWLLFLFWSAAVSLRCCYWAVFERRALSFSSQVMCFDLERAVPAFVFNVGGCFGTWNAFLFHH